MTNFFHLAFFKYGFDISQWKLELLHGVKICFKIRDLSGYPICKVLFSLKNPMTKVYPCLLVVLLFKHLQFSSAQLLSGVRLFAAPWIAVHQASLSITISWSSLRLTYIESVMPSSHLILGRPLLLLPPIPPSIRVFSNESALRMR